MLIELHINNFAIIDHLELSFPEGLIVLTGETGAGKSIIMDALDTLLGSRAESISIRGGAERANIEATFQIPEFLKPQIHEILNKGDLLDDPDYVILEREIRRNGRNIARVNGRTVGVSFLREIGEHLVDMHGQSDHLSLLKINQHLGFLDRFARLDSLLDHYHSVYHKLQDVEHELETLHQDEQEAARKADLLTYQINEITSAKLEIGEEKALREERNRLANAEGLASACREALSLLDESNPDSPSISELFGEVFGVIQKVAKLDNSQESLSELSTTIDGNLTELAKNIRSYSESIEYNPKRLNQVEERIETIYKLKRKYGNSIEEILQFSIQAQQDLEKITHAEERIDFLEDKKETLRKEIVILGSELSDKRHEAALKLQQLLDKEFNDLKLSQAHFRVDFQFRTDPNGILLPDGNRIAFTSNGLERVEFLIETNPGEGYKPLAKIASGGETARIMLALKNVLAQADHIPTLIFDEIDQGIGGRVGTTVGYKLWKLTTQHQVICITHLPQLAAFGNVHLHVEKKIKNNRTITQVTNVKGEERTIELAQMLGNLSEGTIKSANELLFTVKQMIKEEK
ncbi:MAG: DNA repair protein RecN [Anaerolineales bacterium]|nr:DNA repair protein RecN [Anaerolineales bacterium]